MRYAGHAAIDLQRGAQPLARERVVPRPQSEQHACIGPERGGLFGVLQQRLGFRVAVGAQQRRQKAVSHALVVTGIQRQQRAIVFHRLVEVLFGHETVGHGRARAHVGTRRDIVPERPLGILEGARAQGALAGGQRLFVERPGLGLGRGALREEEVSVRAVR